MGNTITAEEWESTKHEIQNNGINENYIIDVSQGCNSREMQS